MAVTAIGTSENDTENIESNNLSVLSADINASDTVNKTGINFRPVEAFCAIIGLLAIATLIVKQKK